MGIQTEGFLAFTSDEDKPSNQSTRSSNMNSIGNELCVNDRDQVADVDNNLFRFQLNNASHDFLGDNLEDKESDDLLYYEWPEIENFEDLDRMFRSCDSTFGLEVDNGDELSWFSSSHDIEGSDEALKSSFNFAGCYASANNGVSKYQEAYGLHETGNSSIETDQKLTVVGLKNGSQKLTPSGSSSVMNGSGTISHIDSDKQIHSPESQSKQQKQVEQKERSLRNGDSSTHLYIPKMKEESPHSLSFQCNFLTGTHQHKTTYQTGLQMPMPLMNSESCHPSNQILASLRSPIIKSEDGNRPFVSLRDSSDVSNQIQSMESLYDTSFQSLVVPGNKKKERLHQHRSSGHLEKNMLMVQKDDIDQNQVSNFESKFEGHCEVNGDEIDNPREMDSSNMQESSCMSFAVDGVSNEENSFRQLQHAMELLDIRMKLRIRDSLYRLARSAERRHNYVSHISGGGDDEDASGTLILDETNECSGFMDMETDTNPIDRSVAHLLFHRPSVPSVNTALDAVPTKSCTMVQAPYDDPLVAEKLVCREEPTSANIEATE